MLMRPDGRLTRQGRLVRTFAFLGLVVTGVFLGSRAFAVGEGGLSPTTSEGDIVVLGADTYTVARGETLWGIAESLKGEGEDIRDVVEEIKELNGMDDSRIVAGEQILVPLASS
jgi:hypothetical protein